MYRGKAIVKTISACIIIYLLLKLLVTYLSPFLLSILIVLVMEPVIKFLMDHLPLSRTVSIMLALLIFCAIIFSITFLTINSVYKETIYILKKLPDFYLSLNKLISSYVQFLEINFGITGDNFDASKILYRMTEIFISLKDKILQFIYTLPQTIIYITFSLVAAFFVLRDKLIITDFISKFLPMRLLKVIRKIYNSTTSILKSELILIGISTLQAVLGFFILDIDYAILLGFFCGILDILPYVGIGIIFIPWSLYCFVSGNMALGIGLLCLLLIITITRQILETRFISGNLELHPLAILFSVYIGLKLLGVTGFILGPLTLFLLKEIYREST